MIRRHLLKQMKWLGQEVADNKKRASSVVSRLLRLNVGNDSPEHCYADLPVDCKKIVDANYKILACAHRFQRMLSYFDVAKQVENLCAPNSPQVASRLFRYMQSEYNSIRKVLVNEEDKKLTNFLLDNQVISTDKIDWNTFSKPHTAKADVLVLCTDLFRDYDDWLALLHTTLFCDYSQIIIITSDEIDNQCAALTQRIVSQLLIMAEYIRKEREPIKFTVVAGLAASDYSALAKEDVTAGILGLHKPPKYYAGKMRLNVNLPISDDEFLLFPDLIPILCELKHSDKTADIV